MKGVNGWEGCVVVVVWFLIVFYNDKPHGGCLGGRVLLQHPFPSVSDSGEFCPTACSILLLPEAWELPRHFSVMRAPPLMQIWMCPLGILGAAALALPLGS